MFQGNTVWNLNSWITACQTSQSLHKLMSIESVMPSSHLTLCRPLLLLPPIPPSIRVFSSESALLMRWPKYWSFSFSISPSNEHSGLISFRMDRLDLLQSKGLSRVFSNTTVQKHQFFGAQLSSQSNSHIHTWPPLIMMPGIHFGGNKIMLQEDLTAALTVGFWECIQESLILFKVNSK